MAPAREKARTFRTGPEARVHSSIQTTVLIVLFGAATGKTSGDRGRRQPRRRSAVVRLY